MHGLWSVKVEEQSVGLLSWYVQLLCVADSKFDSRAVLEPGTVKNSACH